MALFKSVVCKTCDRRRLVKFFNKDKTKRNGFKSMCRDCHRDYMRGYMRTYRMRAA